NADQALGLLRLGEFQIDVEPVDDVLVEVRIAAALHDSANQVPPEGQARDDVLGDLVLLPRVDGRVVHADDGVGRVVLGLVQLRLGGVDAAKRLLAADRQVRGEQCGRVRLIDATASGQAGGEAGPGGDQGRLPFV